MYKIMIVDDREIFRRKFKRFDAVRDNPVFNVEYEAANGREALQLLELHHVDLVITDIRMPVMDGMELLEEIRQRRLCQCVVLLSEYADFAYAQKGIALGAFSYCVKPIENQALLELLIKVQEFLEEEERKNNYVPGSVEALVNMIQEGNVEIREQARAALGNREERAEELSCLYQRLLHEISEKLISNCSYLKKYICIEDISLSHDSKELPEDEFADKLVNLAEKIGHLQVVCSSQRVSLMAQMVLEHVEENISLQKISEQLCISKTYLSHLFKEETGISYMEYATRVKMEHAKVLLHNPDMKIYEISALLGFDDVEYFSRKFREYEGKLPTSYRSDLFGGMKRNEKAGKIL